jgi:hypothetical protein
MNRTVEDRLRITAEAIDSAADRYVPPISPSRPGHGRHTALIGAALVAAAAVVAATLTVVLRSSTATPPSLDTIPPPRATTPPVTRVSIQPAPTTITTAADNPSTGGPAVQPSADRSLISAVAAVIDLPDGRSVSGVEPIAGSGSPGERWTIQVWGDIGTDGVSFDRVIELSTVLTPGVADTPLVLPDPPAPMGAFAWRTNGEYHQIRWAGVERSSIESFINALKPRDVNNPLAGYDDPAAPPLAYEQIGDGSPLPAEKSMNITITDLSGHDSVLSITNREGLVLTLIVPQNRVRIGDRIAIESAPATFANALLTWAGNGIQYTISADDYDSAITLATIVNAVTDQTWLDVLNDNIPDDGAGDTQATTTTSG